MRTGTFLKINVADLKNINKFQCSSLTLIKTTVNTGISLDRRDFFLILLNVPESSLSLK